MNYRHRFRVRAPVSEVVEFHRRSDSLAAITPPVPPLQMDPAPPRLGVGDQMAFRMWLGPIPIRWRAFISQVSSTGFTDHQLEGPFRHWVHKHTFLPVEERSAEVVDEITAALRWHPIWGPVGLMMWLSLPALFAFRGWRTRRILEGE